MIGLLLAQIEAPLFWDICQKVGTGMAVVLGPSLYLVWKAREADKEAHRVARDADATYVREADKNTLKVLWELTSLLQGDGKDGERRQKELMDAIRELQLSIKAHFDATKSP